MFFVTVNILNVRFLLTTHPVYTFIGARARAHTHGGGGGGGGRAVRESCWWTSPAPMAPRRCCCLCVFSKNRFVYRPQVCVCVCVRVRVCFGGCLDGIIILSLSL